MRLVVAFLTAGMVLGSVACFTWLTSIPRSSEIQGHHEAKAAGIFSLELTLTFPAEADDFSLEPSAVLVQFRGQEILRLEEALSPGTPLMIENISGIVQGKNEFYVQVTPRDKGQGDEGRRDDGPALAKAVRLRIFHDGEIVSSETLWSEPDQLVAGPIVLEVARSLLSPSNKEHGHGESP